MSNVRPQQGTMTTPFQYQVSEYDCVPTTMLNAFSLLYKRSEVPPVAIQRVFMYCLDSVSSKQNIGHGTTSFAVPVGRKLAKRI
jgi:hypothetical protein